MLADPLPSAHSEKAAAAVSGADAVVLCLAGQGDTDFL